MTAAVSVLFAEPAAARIAESGGGNPQTGNTERRQIMDVEKIKEYRVAKNNFASALGMRITEITPGHAKMEMDVTEKFMNPIKSVHGGCIYSLADSAAGTAAATGGNLMTTVSSDFHYLLPAIGCRKLFAEADVIKEGKQINVYFVTITGDDGKKLAVGTFTFFNLEMPISSALEEDGAAEPEDID